MGDLSSTGVVRLRRQCSGGFDHRPVIWRMASWKDMALELDLKGFAEDAQRVVVSVKRSVDDGRDHAFGIVREQ